MRLLYKAFFFALALALSACRSEEPADFMQSARAYLAKRDFNAATIQLKNVLQKEPQNAEARYLLALALLENGDAVAAEIELDKAAQLGFASEDMDVLAARTALTKGEPGKVIAQFGAKADLGAEMRALVGVAHLARGERKMGQAALRAALVLDAANVTANVALARLAAAEGKLADALARTETALGASPASQEALVLKADILAAQGANEPAEKAYRAAIEVAPRRVGARVALIGHLVRSRSLEAAAAEAAALESVAPKDPRTGFAKAFVATEQRNFAAARDAIAQVLKVSPEHVPSLILAGTAALYTGAFAEAEGHLRKAVFNAPQATEAKRLLAETHLRMGQAQVALSEVQGLLAKGAEDPRILTLAGEAYLANGDLKAAARHYEKVKRLAPAGAAAQTRLAQIRFAAGDVAGGIAELKSASAADPQAYQADLALIATYLRNREGDKALEALKRLEQKQPDNPLTHNLRGLALAIKHDFSGARSSFERAVQLGPTYMPAIVNLAQLDLRDKNPDAAKKRYEAVLKKEPNNEQALLGLSVLLRITGAKAVEIEKLLKKSVAANPSSVAARTALVNFHVRKRDFKNALAAAQEAQAALPNHPAVVNALGQIQLAASEPRQAIASFTRLAELLPKSPEPKLLLAGAHMGAKQPEEAIKALRAALALRPDLDAAHRDIAAIYVATGRHEDALREAKAVQAEKPKQPFGHMLEAEIYVAQKKLDLAERKYREALKKFDLPFVATRAHAMMEATGKGADADALAEDWIKRHPEDAFMLAYLAERDLATKRYESAAKRYRAALERQPQNAQLLNNLAWTAAELKQPDALQYAERAHELAPNSPAIMDTLGWILAQSGEMGRALELLGRAAELAPQAHQIRLNFAKALIKAERKSAARQELEQLAKLDNRLPVQQEAAKLLQGL